MPERSTLLRIIFDGIDGDIGGRADIDVFVDGIDVAVDGLNGAGNEIDEALFIGGGGILEIENDGAVFAESVGDKLNVVETAGLQCIDHVHKNLPPKNLDHLNRDDICLSVNRLIESNKTIG